jgi:hypothetical protein
LLQKSRDAFKSNRSASIPGSNAATFSQPTTTTYRTGYLRKDVLNGKPPVGGNWTHYSLGVLQTSPASYRATEFRRLPRDVAVKNDGFIPRSSSASKLVDSDVQVITVLCKRKEKSSNRNNQRKKHN